MSYTIIENGNGNIYREHIKRTKVQQYFSLYTIVVQNNDFGIWIYIKKKLRKDVPALDGYKHWYGWRIAWATCVRVQVQSNNFVKGYISAVFLRSVF